MNYYLHIIVLPINGFRYPNRMSMHVYVCFAYLGTLMDFGKILPKHKFNN